MATIFAGKKYFRKHIISSGRTLSVSYPIYIVKNYPMNTVNSYINSRIIYKISFNFLLKGSFTRQQ